MHSECSRQRGAASTSRVANDQRHLLGAATVRPKDDQARVLGGLDRQACLDNRSQAANLALALGKNLGSVEQRLVATLAPRPTGKLNRRGSSPAVLGKLDARPLRLPRMLDRHPSGKRLPGRLAHLGDVENGPWIARLPDRQRDAADRRHGEAQRLRPATSQHEPGVRMLENGATLDESVHWYDPDGAQGVANPAGPTAP